VPAEARDPGGRTLRGLIRYFLRLGAVGFGGPIATVGYIQRDLVERRAWLDEREFLNGVALGQTMPGPLAAQVVMWVGYLERGARGALAVAVPFILPSFTVVLTIAYFYTRYQGLDWVQALFYGIAPGVIAIIAVAAVKLGRLTNRKESKLWIISGVTLAITAYTESEIALLFIGAGVLLLLLEAPPRFRGTASPALLLSPGLANATVAASGSAGTQVSLMLFFLKAGAFIFGSGLAIVPFLREGVVTQHHWLTERQFLDAVAMGLITPGPVVITATFIGYLVGGFTGAAVATVAIFTPIYLGVVVPGRWFVRHTDNPQLKAFVRGATAAAAGAIGGATIIIARKAIIDLPTVLIALASLALVWKTKGKEPVIVGLAAVAGLIFY
jgi:chromate transporter